MSLLRCGWGIVVVAYTVGWLQNSVNKPTCDQGYLIDLTNLEFWSVILSSAELQNAFLFTTTGPLLQCFLQCEGIHQGRYGEEE